MARITKDCRGELISSPDTCMKLCLSASSLMRASWAGVFRVGI